ncbi:MAG: lytic transglycosylase domain-containing protein [Thermoanaerobaculia bacterium]
MRSLPVALALDLAASAVSADVLVATKPDGSKVIYNVGASGHGRLGDLRWLARQRNRASKYDAIIDRMGRRYRVDPVLIRAVIQVESNFDPNCISRKGARGLMQLMPGTAKRYGVTVIHDPEQNIQGGVHYLADLLEMFYDDLPRALAAYNAGENAVVRYKGIPPYEETSTYVTRALTVYYGRPWGQAVTFAGNHNPSLRGGIVTQIFQPLADTLLPNMRYLGAVGR